MLKQNSWVVACILHIFKKLELTLLTFSPKLSAVHLLLGLISSCLALFVYVSSTNKGPCFASHAPYPSPLLLSLIPLYTFFLCFCQTTPTPSLYLLPLCAFLLRGHHINCLLKKVTLEWKWAIKPSNSESTPMLIC